MDINFYAKWVSYGFFVFAAFIHFGFFILEFFILSHARLGQKFMRVTFHQHQILKPWIFNQGIYNLFLVALTLIGIYHIHLLQVRVAGLLIGLAGLFMIIAGATLWVTQPKLRRWAYLQMLPPLLGFLFLSFHAR